MRKRRALSKYVLMLAGACVPLASLSLAAEPRRTPTPADADKTFTTMVNNRCEKCHNATDWAGSLAMDTLDLSHTGQDPEVWEKAIGKLRGRLMPPAGAAAAGPDRCRRRGRLSRDLGRCRREGDQQRRPCADPAPEPHRVRGHR